MATLSMEQVYIEVPSTEIAFLRTLAKKMGWAIKRQRKSGIQEALEDVEAGRVYEAEMASPFHFFLAGGYQVRVS